MHVEDLREALVMHNDAYLRTDSSKIQDHALASLRECAAARDSVLAFLTAPLPGWRVVDDVSIHHDKDGRVLWMSDWTRCEEFRQAGHFSCRHHGPATYGAVTYHVVGN